MLTSVGTSLFSPMTDVNQRRGEANREALEADRGIEAVQAKMARVVQWAMDPELFTNSNEVKYCFDPLT